MICQMCEFDPGKVYIKHFFRALDLSLPSKNQFIGNGKANIGWKYRKIRQEFLEALDKPGCKAADNFRYIGVITRYYGERKRPYDLENLVGGCKPLIDALKHHNIIPDDNPAVWVGYYKQERSTTGSDWASVDILRYV